MSTCLEKMNVTHARLHGAAATAALPEASRISVSQLDGKVATADNASAAQASIRELGALVRAAVIDEMGTEAFESMPRAQQDKAGRVYRANCHRHLGNTWLDGGAKQEQRWFEADNTDALGTGNAKRLRLTADVNKVIHAYGKGLGEGHSPYGKGFGEKRRAYIVEHHKKDLILTIERTDKGARMDACTRAAMVAYHNRPLEMQFMKNTTFAEGNVLRDNLYATFGSLPYIACLRARAIIEGKFTCRHRFFAAATALAGWSALDMARVTDMSLAFFKLCEEHPERAVLNDYDPYEELLNSVPAYKEYMDALDKSTAKSVDKTVDIYDTRAIRAELYAPVDADSIAATPKMLEALRAWGKGARNTIEKGQGARYLHDGELGVDNQTPEMMTAYADTYRHTNLIEVLRKTKTPGPQSDT